MKLWFQHIAILAGIALIVGAAIVMSGIVPIKASSGHWEVTRWLLSFSMSRSVATWSLGVDSPPEFDQAQLVQGAGHYQTGCVQCHGSPERGPNPIARALTPEPPDLRQAVSEWDAEELFYIVMHGVKLTGMPAWPELERRDEVWAMVAFLQELPKLDRTRYRELVYGATLEPHTSDTFTAASTEFQYLVKVACGRCHGVQGHGREGAFPNLAGQNSDYLAASLRAFANGERHSGIMQAVAVPLQEEQIQQLAEYYSQRPLPPRHAATAASDADRQSAGATEHHSRGFQIAHHGVPNRNIPACTGCHDRKSSDLFPVLAAQEKSYLKQQLELFRRDVRGGTSYAGLMHPVTERMTDADIRAVAEYYSARDSEPTLQE